MWCTLAMCRKFWLVQNQSWDTPISYATIIIALSRANEPQSKLPCCENNHRALRWSREENMHNDRDIYRYQFCSTLLAILKSCWTFSPESTVDSTTCPWVSTSNQHTGNETTQLDTEKREERGKCNFTKSFRTWHNINADIMQLTSSLSQPIISPKETCWQRQ